MVDGDLPESLGIRATGKVRGWGGKGLDQGVELGRELEGLS